MTWYFWLLAIALWSAGSGLLWYLGFYRWQWRNPIKNEELSTRAICLAVAWPLVPFGFVLFAILWLASFPGFCVYEVLDRARTARLADHLERAHAQRAHSRPLDEDAEPVVGHRRLFERAHDQRGR